MLAAAVLARSCAAAASSPSQGDVSLSFQDLGYVVTAQSLGPSVSDTEGCQWDFVPTLRLRVARERVAEKAARFQVAASLDGSASPRAYEPKSAPATAASPSRSAAVSAPKAGTSPTSTTGCHPSCRLEQAVRTGSNRL
jgi:hypothetical protein